MRQSFLLSLMFAALTSITATAQPIKNQEITLRYTNGLEIFYVCISNPELDFDEDKEYYWYNDYSKIKTTKGGSGGYLLNGNYKFYDENGNLAIERNFHLGLVNGETTQWDTSGNISSKAIYDNSKMVYWKFVNDEGYWVELIGEILQEGSLRKVYTKSGILISVEENIRDKKQKVKLYYKDARGQLLEEYITDIYGLGLYGKYVSYYPNGKKDWEGSYYFGDFTKIKSGIWTHYDEEGQVIEEEEYKEDITMWENGKVRVEGGLTLDRITNTWQRVGEWKWYDDTGKLLDKIDY